MRKASLLRCNINNGTKEIIKWNFDVNSSEAIKNFSLLPDEEKFLFIWSIVNRATIEMPFYMAFFFSYQDSFLEKSKELFDGIADKIGGDDGAYALCAVILITWFRK